MKLVIYPYNMNSETSRTLAESFDTFRIYPDRNYRPNRNHLILNWGSSTRPNWYIEGLNILNKPENIANAINKIKTFEILKQNNVSTVEWTTNRAEAENWINAGKTVMCRGLVESSGGNGIVIAKTISELIDCNLYTKYFDGKNEYRISIFKNKIIDYTQKRLREGTEEVNSYIKNYANNYVFCRENVKLPQIVVEQAKKAVAALGLDYAAVDIRYKIKTGECKILEVNTAPNLVETSLDRFTENVHKFLIGDEIKDIEYEILQPENNQTINREVPAVRQEVISNNREEILYDFPNTKSVKIIKSGNEHIIKVMIGGREQSIII